MPASLIPALFSVPAAALPPLAYVVATLATSDARPNGEALLLLTKPNVGIGLAKAGVVVGVNQWYANHLGYRPEEMVGLPISTFVVGPYDPSAPGYIERIVVLRHKEGSWVRMRCHLFPLVTDRTDHLTVFELD